jgi:hypothetical protein
VLISGVPLFGAVEPAGVDVAGEEPLVVVPSLACGSVIDNDAASPTAESELVALPGAEPALPAAPVLWLAPAFGLVPVVGVDWSGAPASPTGRPPPPERAGVSAVAVLGLWPWARSLARATPPRKRPTLNTTISSHCFRPAPESRLFGGAASEAACG